MPRHPRDRTTPAVSGRSLLAVVIASMLVISGSARAQEENSYDAWSKLFERLGPDWDDPEADPADYFTQEEYDAISAWTEAPLAPPTGAAASYFEKAEAIAPLIQGLRGTPYFDAGLNFDQGFMLVLPHLSRMREVSRISANLALRATSIGDANAAIRWLGTMNEISFHSGQDGTAIGSLVGAAMYLKADQSMEMAVAHGLVDPRAAAMILESMTMLGDQPDPFHFADSLFGERIILEQSIDTMLDARDGFGDGTIDGYRDAFGDEAIDEFLSFPGDGETMRNTIDSLFGRMEVAMDDPDRERGIESLASIEAEIESLDMPEIIKQLLPAMSTIAEARLRGEQVLADRIRGLEAVASGRIHPDAIRNAALLWDRLGGWFEQLPPPVQLAGLELIDEAPRDERLAEIIEAATAGSTPGLEASGGISEAFADARADPLSTWISEVEPETEFLVTLAADAAAINRCEFTIGSGLLRSLRLRGGYLDRLRGAGRGLLIDATVRLRLARAIEIAAANDPGTGDGNDAASDRTIEDLERERATIEIVSTIALIGDLVTDPAIAHVMLAADLLESVHALLASDDAAAILEDPRSRDMIGKGLAGIPRIPALGIRKASKIDLDLWVDRAFGDRDPDAAAAIRATLDNRGPDRIHALLARCRGFVLKRTPSTPAVRPTAPKTIAGSNRLPVKLIASFEGVHGPGWIVVDTTGVDEDLEMAIEGIRSNPSRTPRLLGRLESAGSFGLAERAARADARIVDLDLLVREQRRSPSNSSGVPGP